MAGYVRLQVKIEDRICQTSYAISSFNHPQKGTKKR